MGQEQEFFLKAYLYESGTSDKISIFLIIIFKKKSSATKVLASQSQKMKLGQ